MNFPRVWQDVLVETRKTVVAVVGIAAMLLAQGVLSDNYAKYAAMVVAIGTALGVYATPNAPSEVTTGALPVQNEAPALPAAPAALDSPVGP